MPIQNLVQQFQWFKYQNSKEKILRAEKCEVLPVLPLLGHGFSGQIWKNLKYFVKWEKSFWVKKVLHACEDNKIIVK